VDVLDSYEPPNVLATLNNELTGFSVASVVFITNSLS
jgi:hypothetical protein